MPEFLASKVLVTEEPAATRGFPPSPAAITGMVGTAERGPIGAATLCTSFEDFTHVFGGYAKGADLPASAQAFFANGGASLYVVRTVHYADPANTDTATAKRATGSIVSETATVIEAEARDMGAFSNSLRLDLRGANDEIELHISHGGARLETYRRLSLNPSAPNYLVTMVNAKSAFIRLTPATDGPQAIQPQSVLLAQGSDGIANIGPADYIGHGDSKTGMRALDRVLDLSLLCIPSANGDVQRAMASYCEKERRGAMFALLNFPSGTGATAAAAYVADEHLLEATEHAAAYWPHLAVPNPAPQVFSEGRLTVPPCGFVAGVMARNGVYRPPAGVEAGQLNWAIGFDHDDCLDVRKRDVVFPKRINPLTTGPGMPLYVDGARTLKGSGLCPYVSHRRGMSYIESALEMRLQYVRHKPITSGLLAEVYREANSYLMSQMHLSAFASQNPKEAFKLVVPQPKLAATIEVQVGLAFAIPGEFVWLRLRTNINNDIQGGG